MLNKQAIQLEVPTALKGVSQLGQNLAVVGAVIALGCIKFTARVPAVSVRGETLDDVERLAKQARLPVSTYVDRLINDELDRLGVAKVSPLRVVDAIVDWQTARAADREMPEGLPRATARRR